MENKKGRLDLLKFNGARKVALSGEKGIFIPVEAMNGSPINPSVFVTEKGAYCSVKVVEHANTFTDKSGTVHNYTHFVKLAVPKTIKDQCGDNKDLLYTFTPILGDLENDEYQPQVTYAQEAGGDMPDFTSGGGGRPF